jgi:hypothetical protein
VPSDKSPGWGRVVSAAGFSDEEGIRPAASY